MIKGRRNRMIDDGDLDIKDDQGRLRFVAGHWAGHTRGKHYAARRRAMRRKDIRRQHGQG